MKVKIIFTIDFYVSIYLEEEYIENKVESIPFDKVKFKF
jgi:hypothetical protein